MHIQEGILHPALLISGGLLAAAGTAVGIRRMDYDRIPEAGVLSAAFFVASLVRVPVGPASAHLLLVGLCGIMLGWSAFPALLTALFLQASIFEFGGPTTVGVNTVNIALPAVACYYLFNGPVRRTRSRRVAFFIGAAAAALGMLGTASLFCLELYLTGTAFLPMAVVVTAAHLPVLPLECILTGAAVAAARKLEPELFGVEV